MSKRLIKLAISACFFVADCVRTGLHRAVGRTLPSRCVVIYYHSIPAKHRRAFARQMDLLLACAQPLCADAKFLPAVSKRYVVVTFDDALESVVHNAVPELVSKRIPATVFVVTDSLGKLPSWGEYGHNAANEKVMTVAQLLSLPSDLITLGSHTKTHPVLTHLGEQEARREIVDSRAALEKLIGKKVTMLSFPHGVFNETVLRLCQEAGYERVFTILPTLGLTRGDEYATGRVWVEPDDWALEFRLKVLGAYRWLVTAFALKRVMTSNRVVRSVLSIGSKPTKRYDRERSQSR